MKNKILKGLLAVMVAGFLSGPVMAKCPDYKPYNCVQGYDGKQVCGCGK